MVKDFTIHQATKDDYEDVRALLHKECEDADYTLEDMEKLRGTQHDPAVVARKITEASSERNITSP